MVTVRALDAAIEVVVQRFPLSWDRLIDLFCEVKSNEDTTLLASDPRLQELAKLDLGRTTLHGHRWQLFFHVVATLGHQRINIRRQQQQQQSFTPGSTSIS